MKTAVYYFSGTGNSLFLAKEIARLSDGALIPIATAINLDDICPDADIIGIVYPVYYNELPVIVKEFAGKLRGIKGKFVFAVCNYGGCGSQSVKTLGEIIRTSGGELAAAYGIHMPQNAFSKPWENNDRLIKKAGVKARKIAEAVKALKRGCFLRGPLNALFVRLHPSLIPRIRADLIKKTGLPPDTDLDMLVRANDKSFYTNGKCVGCRVCAKVCPVGNIKISGGRPTWHGRCENCLACYNWCPQKAIDGGVASTSYYYSNPKISVLDMMAQKNAVVSETID